MDWLCGDRGLLCRVSPFGHPRIKDCSHLPVAFRSFLRPSSAPSAKAFSHCSCSLDLIVGISSMMSSIDSITIRPMHAFIHTVRSIYNRHKSMNAFALCICLLKVVINIYMNELLYLHHAENQARVPQNLEKFCETVHCMV